MANTNKNDKQNVRKDDDGTTPDSSNTLLPMLVAGLFLTIIGMIVVVSFA